MTDDKNEIYVGSKDLKNYVGACLNNLDAEGSDNESCMLISRGRSNNAKALDVAEIIKRENDSYTIESISLSTEEFEVEGSEDDARATSLEIEIER